MSRAAQAALTAWLQGEQSDDVDHLLSRIPLRSPFGPLRLLLKSLITPADAAEKALGLLTMIPAGSMFAAARAAAEASLSDDPAVLLARWSVLRPAQQAFVAETRGLPPTATALLSQITEAERHGPAALFTLLAKPGLPLPADELRIACLNLLPAIPEYLTQFDRRFEPLSEVERGRVLALAAESQDNWRRAQGHWEGVVEALSRQQTPKARLSRAVVLRHLADLAQRHPEVRGDPWTDAVADYLARSLEADPDHLPATLALIEQYRKADSPKDWHQATDLAAQRFPGNTAILLHAVDAAVARSAYKKAVGLARRVLTLDPINQPVRHRMIELQLAYARKQMRSGRADLAGKALSQAAEWERPDAPSAPLRIGQALVAIHGEQKPDVNARLREAVQLAGGGTAGWFRAVLEAALMGWPDQRRQAMHRELANAQTGEPDRETVLSLVAMLGQREIQDSRKVVASVLWRIEPTLAGGSRIVWSSAEFHTIAASMHRLGAFDVLLAYAREAMRRDATDQPARFYRIVAQIKGDRERLTDAQETELYRPHGPGRRPAGFPHAQPGAALPGWSRYALGGPQAAGIRHPGRGFRCGRHGGAARHGRLRHGGNAGQGGPQTGERIRPQPRHRHAGRGCRQLAARRHSLEPAARATLRRTRRTRDRRPRPTGSGMTEAAAVETSRQ